ncbi:MAG: N-acetylmuramoyl-L-alanine amidase [Kofleriaceae bacterium]
MPVKPSGNLIIANTTIHIDAPVVNFLEPPFWNARSTMCVPTATNPSPACSPGSGGQVPYGKLPRPYTQRYSTRPSLRRYGDNPPLDAVKAVIKQFVIHHDGCSSSDMCFSVLQNERGLSCHFLIDNDGTIYQTIDLAFAAYHAAEWNFGSIGVELCNRGDAKKEPGYYQDGKKGPKRDHKACKINGHTFLAFDYTREQYDAMYRLSRALTRILPNIPAEYPQTSPGIQSWDTMPTDASFGFSGFIGHYHLTAQKWDPGPFELKEFCRKLRGALCLPLFTRDAKPDEQPIVPEQSDELKAVTGELYKANELHADGGFFPVGPWGEARLWHGGVHVTAKPGAPVFAPFPGRLVAARMGASSAVGSTNFVLLRHDMALGKSNVQFFSLYMHLVDELTTTKPVAWITQPAWKTAGKPGAVTLLDEPIEAGAVIGHVGTAGPAELARPQIHLELFSNAELFQDWPGSPWSVVDGTAGGRFCDAPQINDIIDTDKSGTLSRQELSTFYAGGAGQQLRFLVTLHVSEWTAEPSWSDALRVPKDFKALAPAEIDQLVAEQITPGLWWDARVAAHCRLPRDGVVYHYHPVSFLAWFNQQLLDAAALAGPGTVDARDAREVPPGVTDDLGDQAGTSMRSIGDLADDPCNQQLGLQELVQGYDAPECQSP